MRYFLTLAVATLASAVLLGCGGGAGADSAALPDEVPTTSNFRIRVTDAPFPFDLVESASVVIDEVRVRETTAGTWTTVFDQPTTIDLVPLTGGVSDLLVETSLAPGTYDEVRLIVSAGEVVLKPEAVVNGPGRTFNVANGGLFFPSGAQTGIKVKVDNDIVVVSALTSELMLDFDLSKNFVLNGPPTHAPGVRRVLFTPVVRAVNTSQSGSLTLDASSDNATPADTSDDATLAGAGVSVLDGGGVEVASGFTGADGRITLSVAPGDYTVEVSALQHEMATLGPVTVAVANLTDAGSVLLVANAGEISGTVLSDAATVADASDDTVLAGATVDAVLSGGATATATTTTDNQGAFQFENLPLGTYDIVVTAAGHAVTTLNGAMPSLGSAPVTITATAWTRTLTGTVVDAAAAGVPDVAVSAVNAVGDAVGSATADANGVYALVLPTGTYDVTFTDPVTLATSTLSVTIVGTDPVSDQALDVTL